MYGFILLIFILFVHITRLFYTPMCLLLRACSWGQ